MPEAITLRRFFDMYTQFAVQLSVWSEGQQLPELISEQFYLDLEHNSLSVEALKRLLQYSPLREITTVYTNRDERNVARDAAIRHVLGYDPLNGYEGDRRKHLRVAIIALLTALQHESSDEGRQYLNATMCPRVCNSLQFYAYENLVKMPEYPRLPEDKKVLSVGQGVLWLAYKAISTDVVEE